MDRWARWNSKSDRNQTPVTSSSGRGRGAPAAAEWRELAGPPDQTRDRALIKAAVDWAVKQNGDSTSRFTNKLDMNHIVSMGHSCGGGLAMQLATEDSRVNGLGIWFSGAGLAGARGNDRGVIAKDQGSRLMITGEEKLDIAYGNGKSTLEAIAHTPIFYAWQDELQHIGNFGAKNGGDIGVLAGNWLEWTTRDDQKAAQMFKGPAARSAKTRRGTSRGKRSTTARTPARASRCRGRGNQRCPNSRSAASARRHASHFQ